MGSAVLAQTGAVTVLSSELALAEAKAGALGFDTLLVVQRWPLNPSHVYTYHVEGLAKGGGLFTLSLRDGKLTRLVDASDGVILDCQVSYDGKQALFSWKRSMSEPFKIWRINTDGSGLTRVIGHDSNNMNACWLPDGGIAFLSDRKPAFAFSVLANKVAALKDAKDMEDNICRILIETADK